jgi:hypothetical protein
MAPHDDNDFIDREFEKSQQMPLSTMPSSSTLQASQTESVKRVPAREQLDVKVGTTHQRLAALKEEQERLEKERITLEDLRRRRSEFSMGQEEMIRNLTKGITILEEEETGAQRQLEAMNRAVSDFREHLDKVQILSEDEWDEENLNRELTRALITIENARKEWISSVPKFPALAPKADSEKQPETIERKIKPETTPNLSLPNPLTGAIDFEQFSWKQWAQFGLALTWPVAAVLLVGVMMLVAIWLQGGS